MILKDINAIKANQEELNRCNQILKENWTDSSSEQFKTTYLGPIEAAGTSFVAESFVHGQTLRRQLRELEELMSRLNNLQHELSDICQHPSWEGYGIGVVEGYTPITHYHSQEFFVITKNEMQYLNESEVMERLASRRVTGLEEMENARFYAPVI